MKQKKIRWETVPWTPFQSCELPTDGINALDPPTAIFRNSRYQVSVYLRDCGPVFGQIAHLSFKVHDKQAHHDWRDMQRIKNELCGEDCDAVEIYPAESKLVDTANQYHLWVFGSYKLPFGFNERLVGDGNWNKSVQRPFPKGERPADCLSPEQFQLLIDARSAAVLPKTPLYCASCLEGFERNDPKLYSTDERGQVLHDEADGTAACGPVLEREGP